MIKPTAPLLVILLTAVFLFLAATNIQGGWLYLVDALLWAVVLMAFILPWLSVRKLDCERKIPGKVSVGERCQVTLTIRNPRYLPLMFVNIEDSAPRPWHLQESTQPISKGLIVSLGKGESFQHSYSFTPEQAGIWIFDHVQTGSFGALGLLGIYRRQALKQALIVHPQIPTETLPLFSAEQQQALQQARHHSHHNEDISHFRAYQPGDNRRQIHWKNTARQQKLIVAEAREEPFQQALVLVDTEQGQAPLDFLRVRETATQVCHALLKQNLALNCWAQPAAAGIWQDFKLPTPTRSLQNIRTWEQLSPWLATLIPDASTSMLPALLQQGVMLNEALIIVIALQPPSELLQRLQQGRQANAPPILIFTEAPWPSTAHLHYRSLIDQEI